MSRFSPEDNVRGMAEMLLDHQFDDVDPCGSAKRHHFLRRKLAIGADFYFVGKRRVSVSTRKPR